MKHVVMFSGGVGSWAAAKRVAAQYGTGDLTLLFCDTLIEDEDLYRFLDDAAADVGGQFVRVADGRTPWEAMRDWGNGFLGNSRVAPCSHTLKQVQARQWLDAHCDPDDTTIYLGIDWSEAHRLMSARKHWQPWDCEAPLCEPPFVSKHDLFDDLKAAGIELPRLYRLGFKHNNCGGFCVRAGQAQFKHLLTLFPERYAEHEAQEEALRQHLGKDVSILRNWRQGEPTQLTLRAFRERVEAGKAQMNAFDWGGCGCFLDEE